MRQRLANERGAAPADRSGHQRVEVVVARREAEREIRSGHSPPLCRSQRRDYEDVRAAAPRRLRTLVALRSWAGRFNLVAGRRGGRLEIRHSHLSAGVGNEEVLGEELTTACELRASRARRVPGSR